MCAHSRVCRCVFLTEVKRGETEDIPGEGTEGVTSLLQQRRNVSLEHEHFPGRYCRTWSADAFIMANTLHILLKQAE